MTRKVSQIVLAKAIDVSERTIAAIETDWPHPTCDILYKAVRFVDLPIKHIFWPERATYTPELGQLLQAITSYSDKDKPIFINIPWAYIRLLDKDKIPE